MNRINIGPDDLETFLAVAELGSFRGAARRLGTSQPSVSARIQRLEGVLGVSLFSRTTRRVVPTEAGQRLRSRAEQTVTELRATVQEFRDEATLKRGHVAIASAASVTASVLPPCIRQFRRRYPDVKLTVSDWFDNTPLSLLRDQSVDIVILTVNEDNDDLDVEPLFQDEIYVVAPKYHPLAASTTADLSTVAKYPFVFLSTQSPTFSLTEKVFNKHGLKVEKVLEMNNLFSLIGLVESGLGLTLLPSVIAPRLNLDMVSIIRVRDVQLVRQISLVTLRGRALSPAAIAFMKLVRTTLGEHSGFRSL